MNGRGVDSDDYVSGSEGFNDKRGIVFGSRYIQYVLLYNSFSKWGSIEIA